MRKPKIAIIHPTIGKTTGGSQIFVLELASMLKDRLDITILSGNRVNDMCCPIYSISRGAKCDTLLKNILKKFSSTPDVVIEHISSFFPVLLNLLNNDYDLIYPNNDWGGLMVASLARKIKGTPILFTEHNGFLEKGKVAARNLKFKPDKYIVLSPDMNLWVEKHFSEISVDYIANGVNLNQFNPEVKPTKIDLPHPIILAVGRNQPNKRLELAIDAVARLNQGSLLLLSSGNNLESLKQKGLELLGDRFKLMTVPYEDMGAFYRACDVFTLPSIYEPFGLVYLEAMACNKPVVAPKDSSRSNIIGKAGFLCDVTNTEAYAEALNKAYLTEFKEIPYEQALNFSWKKCADKYFKVINKLLDQ